MNFNTKKIFNLIFNRPRTPDAEERSIEEIIDAHPHPATRAAARMCLAEANRIRAERAANDKILFFALLAFILNFRLPKNHFKSWDKR